MDDPAGIVAHATEKAAEIVHDAKNTGQAILATAESTAHAIVEAANTEPTNAELKEIFDKHALDDKAFQKSQDKVNEEAAKSRDSIHKRLNQVPTKDDLAKIATKEDIAELQAIIRTAKIGVGALTFTFDNAGKIGTFLLFIFGCYVFLKLGAVGVINWAKSIGLI